MTGQAPDAAAIERLARAALARIPEPFATHLADVVLIVEEFADEETLAEMGIEDPLALTGQYRGRPVGAKSSFDAMSFPDEIYLYRMPILYEWCETGVEFEALINNVVVHEVGHHFGLSDDDIHALEDSAE
ncbi:metallopeptidase family protein [Sphingomonas sp. HF-S3]|uniref:Metallopeptidase family protein n=1 Tax=Sphingomonas rustica TaxID=3103142 RepID=A0ABV0B461_9SPHN